MQTFEQLEKEFGEWTGQPNMVACSSGTAALHMALEVLRDRFKWKEGSEVLVPNFTMAACARAVVMAGLTPVFVDCDDTLNMSFDSFCYYRNSTAVALMAVHIYGRKFDQGLIESAIDYHHAIVEDLAEAHGIQPNYYTDVCCWSFYQNKIVAGEEGGAVSFKKLTNSDKARRLRSLGFGPNQDYWHEPRGHNYRLANCLASKVLDSLHTYSKNKIDRDLLWKEYDAQSFGPRYHPRREPEAKWVYDLRIKDMTWEEQDKIVAALKAVGIQARHGFKPMHMQPEFKNCKYIGKGNSVKCSQETLYLPLKPGYVTSSQIEQSAEIIRKMTS